MNLGLGPKHHVLGLCWLRCQRYVLLSLLLHGPRILVRKRAPSHLVTLWIKAYPWEFLKGWQFQELGWLKIIGVSKCVMCNMLHLKCDLLGWFFYSKIRGQRKKDDNIRSLCYLFLRISRITFVKSFAGDKIICVSFQAELIEFTDLQINLELI